MFASVQALHSSETASEHRNDPCCSVWSKRDSEAREPDQGTPCVRDSHCTCQYVSQIMCATGQALIKPVGASKSF